jgi:hypothetical protein
MSKINSIIILKLKINELKIIGEWGVIGGYFLLT